MLLRREEGDVSGGSRFEGLETTGWGKLGGFLNRICKARRGEIYCRCAHIANEPMSSVVGLVECKYFLATPGRCNRRWDGRQLKMTQDARDH
jgi:hypothetical protein